MHPHFTAHPVGVLRASALAEPDDVPAWPAGPAHDPAYREAWTAWLGQVRGHPVLGAAVGEAAPVLARQVDRALRTGASGPELAKIVRSCTRYVLRAQSRSAPFGLFAGAGTLRFTSATGGGIREQHGTVVRPSAPWVRAVVQQLEACEEDFTARLDVVANDLALIRGGRVLVRHQGPLEAGRDTWSSLRWTEPVRAALDATEAPVSWGELESRLDADFPGRREAVHCLVGTLVHHRVLLTCLHPPMHTPDPLGHLIAAAHNADAHRSPQAGAVLTRLETAQQSLRNHGTAPAPTRQSSALEQARSELTGAAAVEPSATVDLRLESDLTLPRSVAWKLQDAARVLARLSPLPTGLSAWRDYHRRFCERYGVGAMVPVAELVDPDQGLGFPATFQGSRLPAPVPEPVSERDAVLLDLAQRATVEGTDEVVLDQALLERLAPEPPEVVWPHTELRARVHAESRQALDTGVFRLVVSGVSRTAGTTTGRFLDLLPAPDGAALGDRYRALPTLRRNAVLAQLTCPAVSDRGDQVSRTPAVLPTRLALGQHLPADRHTLRSADLAVTADAHRLHLVTRQGRPVEPVVLHAIELTRAAHPLMRFLAELPWNGAATPAPFSWGAASHLPVLPRVRWGRCVLSPTRWRLDEQAVPAGVPSQKWTEALEEWRRTYRVPAQVEVGEGDQRLRMDLTLPAHQDLVRTELSRSGRVWVREASTEQDLGWLGGRAHEIVATLTADQAPLRVRARPGSAHPRCAEHLPATAQGWCSVKLYGHPDQARDLITSHLPRLRADDAALVLWFLRYRDPEPHLRVRIRITGPDQLRAVHDWARELREQGVVSAVVQDTYTPESGRFGPGSAMAAAEWLFVADSRAAASQLAAEASEDGTRVWAAVGLGDLTERLLGDAAAARRWLIEHAPRTAVDRSEAARVIALSSADQEHLPAPLRDAWAQRAEAASVYAKALTELGSSVEEVLADLLHLHATRLFGPDPGAERTCLALARTAAVSRRARSKENR